LEKNQSGLFKTKIAISNLKNDILISTANTYYDFSRQTVLKLFFLVLICFYAFKEGFQLKDLLNRFGIKKGIRVYIWSFETLLDTYIILISLFYCSTIAYNYFVLSKINISLIGVSSDFFSIDFALNLEENLKLQCNLMIFASFLKALNLLKFNPKTYLITDTLSFSLIDLAFLIMFVFINYIIFGIIGHGLFYIDPQFNNNKNSIQTSILSIVRHIEFDLLADRNFFSLFAWQIFVWFYIQRTLINFVISIIIANFNNVRSTHLRTKTEKTFSRIIKNSLHYFNIK